MQKMWKITAVCLATVLLLSALWITVSAEGPDPSYPATGDTDNPILPNEPDNPDEPGIDPEQPDNTNDPSVDPDNTDTPDQPDNTDPTTGDPSDVPTGESTTDTTNTPTEDSTAPQPTYTDPIVSVSPTQATEITTKATETTDAAPSESATAPTHSEPLWVQDNDTQKPTQSTAKADAAEDTAEEEFPFDVRTTVIYSLVALTIMVAGGVAIYIITKHKPTNQQDH